MFFVPISIRPEKLDNELSMMIVGQCGKVAELHSVRSVAYAARMLPEAYKTKAEKLQAPALNKEERDALEAGLDADALGGLLLPPI